MGSVVSIARQLRAQRQGNGNWRCLCPLDCGYSLSLAEGEDGRLLAYCFGGCDFADIVASLVGFGLLDDADSELPHEEPVHKRAIVDQKLRIESARWLYSQTVDAVQVRTYLRARNITVSSPVLRFHQSAPHRLGVPLPAMIAPVVDIDGLQIGAHVTYLRPDGSAKADFADPDYQRECRGVIRGGAIRLAAHDPDCELLVGEGVETVLAAAEIFKRPGWAAVYGGNLKKDLVLPPEVRRVVIVADNDKSGTGQKNALAAKQRWLSEGRTVRIVMPPRAGTDFNDFLMEGTRGAGRICRV